MTVSPVALRVLAAYGPRFQPRAVAPLGGAGGFSGAELWRVTTAAGDFCLRGWPPEHPTPERLQFLHAVLRHAFDAGFRELPLPVPVLASGQTWIEQAGRRWELAPWLPGVADYHAAPRPAKLTSALGALARFHCAAASFPERPAAAASPGLRQRHETLVELLNGGFRELSVQIREADWPELTRVARRLLELAQLDAPRAATEVAAGLRLVVPLQPCLRDIWHDHVLFTGDVVTGLIDFGAMRHECVAGDIARLLGSLVQDDAKGWQHGLAAYQAVRPLSPNEAALVTTFDRSAVVLSGINWLRWIYVEGRHFENRAAVLGRLEELFMRLELYAIHDCQALER